MSRWTSEGGFWPPESEVVEHGRTWPERFLDVLTNNDPNFLFIRRWNIVICTDVDFTLSSTGSVNRMFIWK